MRNGFKDLSFLFDLTYNHKFSILIFLTLDLLTLEMPLFPIKISQVKE